MKGLLTATLAPLLALGALVLPATAAHAAPPPAGMTFSMPSDNPFSIAWVTGYDAAIGGTDVVIPTTVTIAGSDYTVTAIGSNTPGAFQGEGLTSVTIPDSVTYIGDNAFTNNDLSGVTIPDTVTTIGYGAFANNALTSVVIPASVQTIGNFAFADNQIATLDFAATSSLLSIGNSAFTGNDLTSVTIPASVYTIGNFAFADNQIATLDFAATSSLLSIGNSAFINNQLTSLTIPASMQTIGNFTFASNEIAILDFSVPASLTDIGNSAFNNNRLTSVEIPEPVITLGNQAFQNNQLTSITLPNTLTTINLRAFLVQTGDGPLTSVTIPASVTTIGANAFWGHPDFAEMHLEGAPPAIGTPAGATSPSFGAVQTVYVTDTVPSYVTAEWPLWQGYNAFLPRTVMFEPNGGTAVPAATVNHGTLVGSLPTPVRSGYTFAGWFASSTDTAPLDGNAQIIADITLYAGWQIPTSDNSLAESGFSEATVGVLAGLAAVLLGGMMLLGRGLLGRARQ